MTQGRRIAARVTLSIGEPAARADSRLEALAESLNGRPGIRVQRRGLTLLLSVATNRIEQLGPLIEAAAASHGLSLRLVELDAVIRPADLAQRPSGVWASIGDAALAHQLATARGEVFDGDVFRYVRVEDVDGTRVAVDGRPPRVEPVGDQVSDAGPTKYEDIDYHDGAAIDAGQPPENGFAHIGFYLAWLIRHDLHNRQWFSRGRADAVKGGEMSGTDLLDETDGKLMSDFMSDEGIAFSDARYEAYVAAYDRTFADAPPYSVVDTPENYALVAPLVDELYDDWVRAERVHGRSGAESQP